MNTLHAQATGFIEDLFAFCEAPAKAAMAKPKATTPSPPPLPCWVQGQSYKVYAGAGALNAPMEILEQLRNISRQLAAHGYRLQADENHGVSAVLAAESNKPMVFPVRNGEIASMETARLIHPAPWLLPNHILAMIQRDLNILRGPVQGATVDFLVVWSEDGCENAATRTARSGCIAQIVGLADHQRIPIFNLRNSDWSVRLTKLLRTAKG